MPDEENDRLRDELTTYHLSLAERVEPAGPVAVRRAVRRRRRTSTALAAAGVLVVTVPLAKWVAVDDHPSGPPVAAAPTATATETETAPLEEQDEEQGASSPAVPSLAPNASITRADLLAATVEVPPWPAGTPCASGPIRLVDPPASPGKVILSKFAGGYGDVDEDGVAEPVVLIRCLVGNGEHPVQVLALDRNANGQIIVLGQVFRSDADQPEHLYSLNVRPDGLVRVEVTDVVPGSGQPAPEHRQWRGFRWDGHAFQQTSGPTGFAQ